MTSVSGIHRLPMQNARASILIVEDEPKLAQLLVDYLSASGFATRVLDNGLDVVRTVRDAEPDLILLDLMLPGKDGIDLCRELRAFSQVPIIMVTARVEEVDRLLGLELGADDYVCKPFHPREVVARVRSQLRRIDWLREPEGEPLGGLVLEETKYEARLNGRLLDLTPVEFRLLSTLFRQPGRVFSRDQLIENVYTDHRIVTDRTVDTHVKNLRRKLKELAPDSDSIRSVYGIGYKLEL
jgi:two-component system, OmpR family, response regulator BaeR